jgi:hypothetical protein
MLLNDTFVQGQAAALAKRILREEEGSDDKRIQRAFRLVLQREPARAEMQTARALLKDQMARAQTEGSREPALVALESFCRGLLNVNEMIYVD